jgi:hypothetical protein
MKNVTPISAARKSWAPTSDGPEILDDFFVAFDDVVLYSQQDPQGNYIRDNQDAIELGPRAALQVKHIFWRFGLRRMPQTWGELKGNWAYCVQVKGWLLRFSSKELAAMQQLAHDRHERNFEGRGQMLRTLAAGNLDAVWRWHESAGVFDLNAKDPFLTQD